MPFVTKVKASIISQILFYYFTSFFLYSKLIPVTYLFPLECIDEI